MELLFTSEFYQNLLKHTNFDYNQTITHTLHEDLHALLNTEVAGSEISIILSDRKGTCMPTDISKQITEM